MTIAAFPPGPTDAAFGMTLANRFKDHPLEFMTDMAKTYGDIVYLRFGPIQAFGLNKPELVKELLVTKNKAFHKMDRMKQVMSRLDGNGLLLSEGEFWLRQRRLVQPAFDHKRLVTYAQTMVQYTSETISHWKAGEQRDLFDDTTKLTLRIICRILFNIDAQQDAEKIGAAIDEISRTMVKDMSAPFLLPDWLPIPEKSRWRENVHILDSFITKIMADRKASGHDKGDLLSMLLLAVDSEGDGTGMSEKQARDEAMTLFLAGHDSTAAALAWTWYLLARHQDVQDKVAAEVLATFGTEPPHPDGARKLTFTTAVLKESMRLYPPVWLIPRQSVAETEIGGYRIPPGSFVYAWTYALHRSPRFWAEPEEFQPERFLPENESKVIPHSYIPFGEGPRGCIGNHFAMLESTLIVACVLQRFSLSLCPQSEKITQSVRVSLEPANGVHVRLASR